MKTCSKCGKTKAIDEFSSDKKRKDGKYPQCKPCFRSYKNAWRAANAEKVRADAVIYHKENHARVMERRLLHKQNNEAAVKEIKRVWQKTNSHKVNEGVARRRYLKEMATPAWGSRPLMVELYDIARRKTSETGVKWHVDHIVPLTSDVVCGLHVESNLRVILGSENISKLNRHWPDMPGEQENIFDHTCCRA